jgi:hypothetical protein
MKQRGTFILAKIEQSAQTLESLRSYMVSIGDNIKADRELCLADIPILHFASFFILEESGGTDAITPHLGLELNYDGDFDNILGALFTHSRTGLERIYNHCQGYPSTGFQTQDQLSTFFKSRIKPNKALFIGSVADTVRAVRAHQQVWNQVSSYLDDAMFNGRFVSLSAREIHRKIRDYVMSQPDLASALAVSDGWTGEEKAIHLLKLAVILGGLGAAIWALGVTRLRLPVAIILFIPLCVLLGQEATDPIEQAQTQVDHVQRLVRREDFQVQNHMITLSPLKPGFIRLGTLELILKIVDFGTQYIFTKGKLLGLISIHFARWLLLDLDGRKRLVFLSNYDGSWEHYLGEFIDQASIGLNAIWTNTTLFPRTRFLIFGGAVDEQRFKSISRRRQLPDQIWYSAYKDLSVVNVNNNSAMCRDLKRDLTEDEAKAWLRHFSHE